jgi:hypothetical protein
MILDYTTHVNVADGHDAVDKIRAYAVSKGWTQQAWQANMNWTGTTGNYNFTSQSGSCYLCLTSTGYGTTSLIARMCIHPGKYTPWLGEDYFYVAMANSTSIDYTTVIHPWAQYSITNPEQRNNAAYSGHGMHLGKTSIQKMWIFGDSKWIMAVFNYDGSHCCALHFGQMEMLVDNPSQGQCRGVHHLFYNNNQWWPPVYSDFLSYPASGTASYYVGSPFWPRSPIYSNYNYIITSFDIAYSDNNTVPYSNQGLSSTYCNRIQPNISTHGGADYSTKNLYYNYDTPGFSSNLTSNFPDLSLALNLNTYSNRRVMIKPVYAVQSRVDSTYRPVTRGNYYLTRFNGLTIGQQLAYGTEQYLVFPVWHISEPFGFALRIA